MKILVISSNLIGDTVLSTGVIEDFIKKYPNSKLTIVIGPSAAQIYEHAPNLDKIIIIKKKKFNLHWFEIYKKCFFNKWDIIIDFRSSLISYILFNKKKFIFKKNNRNHHLNQLSSYFNFDCNNLKIYNSDKENNEINTYLEKNKKYIVICPGGNWKPKIWPVENFNLLVNSIKKIYSNVKFIIVGSKLEEENYFINVIKGLDKDDIINLMGKSLTLTSAYMKKSTLFIGNDSGLMHLSVVSKLNTIGLFGPTNDKIYSPIGENCFVIRTKESYDSFSIKNIDQNVTYMNSIDSNQIIDLITNKKLLD